MTGLKSSSLRIWMRRAQRSSRLASAITSGTLLIQKKLASCTRLSPGCWPKALLSPLTGSGTPNHHWLSAM